MIKKSLEALTESIKALGCPFIMPGETNEPSNNVFQRTFTTRMAMRAVQAIRDNGEVVPGWKFLCISRDNVRAIPYIPKHYI